MKNNGSGVQKFRGSGLRWYVVLGTLLLASCSSKPAAVPAQPVARPNDAQHANITTPHGDHSPHHGGMVLMNGEVHYEVVFDPAGKHRVWFSDAVREELPASIATKVAMTVARPNAPPEALALQIDDSGESWVADGKPVAGKDVIVKLTIVGHGEPYEVDLPFVTP
jgi:hypothetical protein